MLGLEKSEELVQKINQRRLNCPNLNPHNCFLELLHSITSNEIGKLTSNKIDVVIGRDYISVEYDAEPLTKAEMVRFTTGWYPQDKSKVNPLQRQFQALHCQCFI